MQAHSASRSFDSIYPPSAHSELWSNPKDLTLHHEHYNRSGLTDVKNQKYNPVCAPCKSHMYSYLHWRPHDDNWRLVEVAGIDLIEKSFQMRAASNMSFVGLGGVHIC